jgi:hypothetical protein
MSFPEGWIRNERGLLGLRFLILLLFIGFAVYWATQHGYIRWHGSDPTVMTHKATKDMTRSAKDLVK